VHTAQLVLEINELTNEATNKSMKINIVSYEPSSGWILYDYALRIAKELETYVDLVNISHEQRPGYDVTFHINYAGLREIQASGVHCTLVTHIDTPEKFSLVNMQANAGVIGYCMSADTARRMNSLTGTRSFFNFAPPAMITPPSNYRRKFLISSRLYPDGRKNEDWTIDFFSIFNHDDVLIRIMGAGWQSYVSNWDRQGYAVEYCSSFDQDLYVNWLRDSDYLLYTGHDEGALSTLDALLYGVVPICTAQGYHLEQGSKIHLFQTRDELVDLARELKREHDIQRARVTRLTDWASFAQKHVSVWNKALDMIIKHEPSE